MRRFDRTIREPPCYLLLPLLVVYTRTHTREIQVLYFTVAAAAEKRLLWTNSSYLTVSDRVFKQGPLFAAAGSTRPFSSLAIE